MELSKLFTVFKKISLAFCVLFATLLLVAVIRALILQGTDEKLQPYLLAAHLDVVPVTRDEWQHEPFGGVIEDEFVYGRGAIDDKLPLVSIMSTLEFLTESGWQPKRSFFVAFGHDEEVAGLDGAAHIGRLLQTRNVSLDFVWDEGLMVLDGVVNGLTVPVATIGISEKGYLTLEIEARGEAGHSSMPPYNQAVTRLARAVARLSDNHHPSMFGTGPEVDMLAHLAHKVGWPAKLVLANPWLFKPLLEWMMTNSREMNAMIRTTTAVTILDAGFKENVIPLTAKATVNHRIHPTQSVEDVIEYDHYIINDPEVTLKILATKDPHPVSPYGPEVSGYRLLAMAVAHFFPNAIPIPSLMIANTDTFAYLPLTKCVYRFNPLLATKKDLATIHAAEERVHVDAVKTATRFYHHVILAADDDAQLMPSSSRTVGDL